MDIGAFLQSVLQVIANIAQIFSVIWTLWFGGRSLHSALQQRTTGRTVTIKPVYVLFISLGLIMVLIIGASFRPIFIPVPNPFHPPTPPIGTNFYTLRGTFTAMAWSHNGKSIAIAQFPTSSVNPEINASNPEINVYDASTQSKVDVYDTSLAITNSYLIKRFLSIEWSYDDTKIAAMGDNETIYIWNATTRNIINSFVKSSSSYYSSSSMVVGIAWSPDGERVASAYSDGTVQSWNAVDGTNPYSYGNGNSTLYSTTPNPTSLAWSPNGKYIAVGWSDGSLQIWNASTQAQVATYKSHTDRVNAITWSPNSKYLASASHDTTIQVHDVTTGVLVNTYKGHHGNVLTIAWSPDGQRIASGSTDMTVQVWDATTGGNVYTYSSQQQEIDQVAWSSDGSRIASMTSQSLPSPTRTMNIQSVVNVWQAQ